MSSTDSALVTVSGLYTLPLMSSTPVTLEYAPPSSFIGKGWVELEKVVRAYAGGGVSYGKR